MLAIRMLARQSEIVVNGRHSRNYLKGRISRTIIPKSDTANAAAHGSGRRFATAREAVKQYYNATVVLVLRED